MKLVRSIQRFFGLQQTFETLFKEAVFEGLREPVEEMIH